MTISSMTGYARAAAQLGSTSWVWEIKSVNGRGLEVRVRVGHGFDGLDLFARELAAKRLKRGNLQVSLNLTRGEGNSPVRINRQFLNEVLNVIGEIAPKNSYVDAPRWDGLLALRGVIEQVEQTTATEEDVAALDVQLRQSFSDALDNLIQMREAEGQRLAQMLLGHLDEITDLAARAGNVAALRPEAVKERMRAQLAHVMDTNFPEDRLIQEIALLAVKADVREEIDRLNAHVAAARDLLKSGGSVGRKLDFLSQEFNREANTLCSKAQDVELTRIGLDLKAAIDQFREQVQNVE